MQIWIDKQKGCYVYNWTNFVSTQTNIIIIVHIIYAQMNKKMWNFHITKVGKYSEFNCYILGKIGGHKCHTLAQSAHKSELSWDQNWQIDRFTLYRPLECNTAEWCIKCKRPENLIPQPPPPPPGWNFQTKSGKWCPKTGHFYKMFSSQINSLLYDRYPQL